MISFILLIITLITIYILYRKIEHFNNYKSVLVTPNKNVYLEPKLILPKIDIPIHISSIISKNLPIKSIIDNKSINTIIDNIKPENIYITSLYDIYYKQTIKKNENIKFISKLFSSQLTIITNSNYKRLTDFKDKIIYVPNKISAEYYILNKLKAYYGYTLKVLSIENNYNFRIQFIKKLFKKSNIALAIFMAHPNQELIDIIKSDESINLVSINNIDKDVFETTISEFQIDKIDSNNYYNYRNDMITTIANPYVLVTHKTTNNDLVFIINRFIYSDFVKLKQATDNNLKQMIKYFNLNNTYSSNIEFIDIHTGTHLFYSKKGFISNNDRNICRKYVSIKNCDLENEPRLNPYRLL